MKWRKHDDQTIKSDDGTYAISRFTNGVEEWFEVWRTRAHRDGPALVKHDVPTAQEARKLAQQDSTE